MALTHALTALCMLALAAPSLAQDPCGATQSGTWRVVDTTPCTKNYEVCRTSFWRSCSCVLGVFNNALGRCDRFSNTCPDNEVATYYPEFNTGRKKRSASNETITSVVTNHRVKRQACPAVYNCPSNVNQVVVYPDWEQSNCNTFHLCYRGSLKTTKCPVNSYYNPHLLSCEQYPDLTNACVWRQYADYPHENSLSAEAQAAQG